MVLTVRVRPYPKTDGRFGISGCQKPLVVTLAGLWEMQAFPIVVLTVRVRSNPKTDARFGISGCQNPLVVTLASEELPAVA